MGSPLIQFLGTGNAFNSDGRGTQSILIAPGSASPFLVDLGPNSLQAMIRFDVDWRRIDRLFVTHLHGDHTAGWPFLLLNMIILDRRSRPFDVYGPVGVRRCLEGLATHCFGDVLERQAFDVRYHEIPVRKQQGIDGGFGMQLDLLPMSHHGTSIAYRFRVDDVAVAVSGDTAWCDNLEALGRASDLLIMECSSVEQEAPGHLWLQQLRQRRKSLGSAKVVLVHLTDAVAEDLARDPLPDLVAAYDGMIYLP
jgi:ribonuclease BN (tRNA processing enzyme)